MVRGASLTTRARAFAEPLESRILLAPLLFRDLSYAASSDPSSGITVGSKTFFAADDGVHGAELWVTDGTASGTNLVKDIRVGELNSQITFLGQLNGYLFFSANDGNGQKMWRSDGTESGTIVFSQAPPPPEPGRAAFFPMNGVAYFRVGTELWKTDGEVNHTGAVDFSHSYGPLTQMGNYLYFVTNDVGGTELWRTDGTYNGRAKVVDTYPNGSGNPQQLTVVNNTLYFVADSPVGWELWKSDGTPQGSSMVREIIPGPAYSILNLTGIGNTVVFKAVTDAPRLWRSDGTAAGTFPIADLDVSRLDGLTTVPFEKTNSAVYFRAGSAGQTNIYKTDGTAAGTLAIKSYSTATEVAASASSIADSFFFSVTHAGQYELWKSTGAEPLATLVTSAFQDVGQTIGQVADKTLLSLDDSHGMELWALDPAQTAPTLIKDINPGVLDSAPHQLITSNGALYFTALHRIWKSDGTSAGTIPIARMTPAFTPSGYPTIADDDIDDAVDLNGVYLFANYNQLWRSDGTPGGTSVISTGPIRPLSGAVVAGGYVYYTALSSGGNSTVWRSDGTAAGTILLKDFTGASGSPGRYAAFNGKVYFTVGYGTGTGLWRTDGTPAGTVFFASGDIANLAVLNNKLYYVGCVSVRSNCQLWSTDGNSAGAPVNPASGDKPLPAFLTVSNGALYYQSTRYGFVDLVKTNGTVSGTQILKTIPNGSNLTDIRNLFDVDGTVFFTIGSQLWRTNGTAAGTISLGSFPDTLYCFTAIGGRLFFLAGPSGTQLWKSDGTAAGTVMVMAHPAPMGSYVPVFSAATLGDYLYFRASTPSDGAELFRTSRPHPRSSGPYTVGIGSSIQLDASTSSDPDPSETLSFAWDLDNDNIFETIGSTPTFAAQNLPTGSYPVKLRVTNSFGLSSTLTTSVSVRDAHFHGSAGDDNFRIAFNPANSTANFYENTAPGAGPTFSIHLSGLSPITIDAGGGNDSLLIDSGSFALSASTDLENLILTGASAIHLTSSTNLSTLALQDTSTLDIGDSLLTLNSANLSAITTLINSNKLITFSTHADSRLAAIANSAGQIQVLCTLIGDLNFDRAVSIADFITLASHFNQPGTWADGDVNGDGNVTVADFIDLTAHFNQSVAAAGATPIEAAQPAADLLLEEPTILTTPDPLPSAPKSHRRRPHRHHRTRHFQRLDRRPLLLTVRF